MKKTKNQDFINNQGTSRASIYWELSKLFAKNYFKSFPGPFFTFALPVFFLFLFFFTLGNSTTTFGNDHGHTIIGGYILLASISCGFNFLSGRICEWKNSVFLKRLNVTPLKKWEFMMVIIFFYSFICILGTIWMLIWAMIVNPEWQIQNWAKYSNWGFMILGIICNIFVSISVAIFVGGIATSSSMGEGITTLIFFPSIFLTGVALPIQIFGNGIDTINIIGYFIPFKYSVSIFLYGWWYTPTDIAKEVAFSLKSIGFDAIWQPLLGAILYPSLLLLISTKTFKW